MISDETIIVIARVLLAGFLGALVGFERDIHGRSAGLRTHLLVCMGSAVFMALSELVAAKGSEINEKTWFTDPGRIAAQIVTGIGFIGAGVIIKEGVNVRGLTTSACLWIAAGIGMAAGAGFYILAVVTTLAALFGLVVLKKFERVYKKDSYRVLTVKTPLEVDSSDVIKAVKNEGIKVMNCDIHKNYEQETTVSKLTVRLFHKDLTDKLAHGIIDSLEASKIKLLSVSWNRY